jgi:DNA-binding GntR family transcriptional regulator
MVLTTKEVGSKRLSEQLYNLIKRDILESNLESGQLLEEATVSERYQIGRTPFREACQRLEAEGLIEIVPHRGVFIASFSSKDVHDLFELRLIVEPSAAELACLRQKEGSLKRLEVNLKDCARLMKNRPSSVTPEINWNSKDFHVGVAALTHNEALVDVVEGIHDKLMRILTFTARHSPENYPFNALHVEIHRAIERGSAAEARKLMTRDIEQAHQWIREYGR